MKKNVRVIITKEFEIDIDDSHLTEESLKEFSSCIFKTKEEAEIGFRHHIEEEAARMLAVQTKERNDLLNKEKYLRSQLARIQAIKLEEIK